MCTAEPKQTQVRGREPVRQKLMTHLLMGPCLYTRDAFFSFWFPACVLLKDLKKSLLATDTLIIHPFCFQLSCHPRLWFSGCTFGIFSGHPHFKLPLLILLWVLISRTSLTGLKTV